MSNKAAWITEAKANPLQVKEAPLPKAGAGEVVIKNHAIAVNPVEWQVQDNGIIIQKYPNIIGCDVAGEVYEVGGGVTHVKKGDRVTGHATGLLSQDPADGAFQLYTKCTGLLVQKIPSSVSFAEGSVLPLSVSTAAQALFKKETLGLPFPTTSASPPSTGKSVLVWGGSSSVGASAIQLAAGVGVKVVTVASKHNLDKVKELGAAAAFDYRSPSVIDDIISALSGTNFAGVCDCIGSADAAAAWTPIYQKLGGRYGTVNPFPQGLPEGIQGTNAFAAVIATADRDVAEAVWGKWISWALENGKMKAKPDPIVVGKGLESLQKGMDEQRKGVSYAKVVVEV